MTTIAPSTQYASHVAAHTVEAIAAAADVVRAPFPKAPAAALVLGSGLGALGREIAVEAAIDYRDIPGFPLSTVESHAGRLL